MHAGSTCAMPPFVYHRTVSASEEDYESILIKFRPEFVNPLTDMYGGQILERLVAQKGCRFTDEVRQRIESLFRDILEVYEGSSEYKEIIMQGILIRIILEIIENGEMDDVKMEHKGPISNDILEVIFYMEQNYGKKLRLEEMASNTGYSTAYFSRLFHKQMGKSFTDYLTAIRVRNVAKRLISTDKSITEIALETGFQYPSNLTAVFREQTGLSPKDYRKLHKDL